jgi:hypothetical protein
MHAAETHPVNRPEERRIFGEMTNHLFIKFNIRFCDGRPEDGSKREANHVERFRSRGETLLYDVR